jgi:23S rRNA (uracil1939-C5)-methyltransferase
MSKRGGRAVRDARDARAAKSPAARLRDVPETVATLRIESLAAGGDGVGRIDGLACFVPRTAPGDLVQVAMRVHARHARGRVLQLLEPSPLRVAATCRHYDADRCGGCQLQHVNESAQRDARRTIVRDALRRIGKREVELPELVSGASWAYRGRLTLTLRARSQGWVGGLHPFDDPTRVFALEECAIAHPSLLSAWHAVRGVARGLPASPVLRLALRRVAASATDAGGPHDTSGSTGSVALVVSGGSVWPDAKPWAALLMRAHPAVIAIWWERDDGVRDSLSGDVAAEVAEESFAKGIGARDDVALDAPPDADEALAFAQVNAEVAQALRSFVVEQVRALAPNSIVDAYAGVGILSEILSSPTTTVTAIESDGAGADQASRRLASHPRTTVIRDSVESALPSVLPADVVVLNPPRRGVDVRVTALLADAATRGVRGIVYVSCDPATLARDLSRLPAWRISALRCFDMFPQTAHVETVCVLVPVES